MIRVLAPLGLALMLGACNTSAGMFEDESEGTPIETNAFGSLLSMTGVVPKQQKPIEYAPRAPLAMPGSADLPSPEAASSAEAAVNFPVDQERQDDAAIAALRGQSAALDRRTELGDARALPGEIQATTGGRGVAIGDARDMHGNISERDRLSRDELKIVVKDPNRPSLLTEEGTAAPRTSLAIPPGEYRTPAATAALPEEGDIENSDWVNKRLYQRDDRRPARMQDGRTPTALDTVLR